MMKKKIAAAISGSVSRHPIALALCITLLLAFSSWRFSKLTINYNQLDLLDQTRPEVKATQEMIDLVGGVGFLLIGMKGTDIDHVKQVSDDIAAELRALPEIRKVTNKQQVQFIRDRLGLFIETADLEEAYKRISKKVKSVIRAANPFAFSLGTPKKEEPFTLDDIVDKYRSMNKKRLDDDYYVDPKSEMVLMVIKPNGDSNDLKFCRDLINTIDQKIAAYNKTNTRKAALIEHYEGFAPSATVTYGYTGNYKRNLDDSESMKDALAPTSIAAFIGILLYLLITIRRVSQVLLIMLTLVGSVVVTFAFCEITIGELNTITALLGAVLMGVGIDFGIHLTYRLREEYTRHLDLQKAIAITIEHSGSASALSATTTSVGLFMLMGSGFGGFADFGFLMGAGILITFALTYLCIPVIYTSIDKVWPSFKNGLLLTAKKKEQTTSKQSPYPYARAVLIGSIILTIVLAFFAKTVAFNYDSRAINSTDRPSVLLQLEIDQRYKMSSDPVGIFTPTLKAARLLYEQLSAHDKETTTIDSVISLFRAVPRAEQQEKNYAILQKLLALIEPITPAMLSAEEGQQLEIAKHYLKAKPFTVKDIPDDILAQFQPTANSGRDGFLTFIYPKTSLWDGKELMRFVNEVGAVVLDGKTYQAAGMAILFGVLTETVLADGKSLTILAALGIFFVIIAYFRNLRAAFFAMLPLICGMIWMLGLMAITDWKINFMNIVVFPVVFGYGISNGLHIYNRYLEGDTMGQAIRHTGAAVIASSVTTFIGWAALLVSGHRGLESMGVLACFGIASALAVSLTILPSLVQVLEGRLTGLTPKD